jgi:hypothetical protein
MSFAVAVVAGPGLASAPINAATMDDGTVPSSRDEVLAVRLPRRSNAGHKRPPFGFQHARSTAFLAVRS